jgi:hypothetical protein
VNGGGGMKQRIFSLLDADIQSVDGFVADSNGVAT